MTERTDETTIDVETVGSMKVNDRDNGGTPIGERPEPDTERETRTPEPTLRKAEVGLLLASGEEKQLGPAMVRAGYAKSTAAAPKRNGVTVAGALAAAAEVFPEAPTLRTLKAKSLHAINAAFDDDDLPSLAKAQLGGNVVKLAVEIGEGDDYDEAAHSTGYYRRQARRSALRAWQMGARYAAQHGLDAALQHAQELAEQIEVDAPYLDAQLPPRANREPLQTTFQRRGQ